LVLSAFVLFCCSAVPTNAPKIPATPSATALKNGASAGSASAIESTKPDAPAPKTLSPSSVSADSELTTAANSAIQPPVNAPLKPATPESYETARQRTIWYGLMAAAHGAAGFDAWTTRRALRGGYGVEGDPLQRPFASSGAIYATTQVAPVILDYLGYRMMRSRHNWIRKAWWVPQAASAGVSLGAGIHNYALGP
jgi:hypothetical protein